VTAVAEAGARHRRLALLLRAAGNLVGAAGAAFFVRATLRAVVATHRPIGVALLAQELWVVAAYLVRRPARAVTARPLDWALAFAGTFGGVLLRPSGAHPAVGLGLAVQVAGLVLCVASFAALGRSFGFAAADRGLARRGPYAVVRHPVYASDLVAQAGYLLQSASPRNLAVVLLVTACNAGRAVAEERLLGRSAGYRAYAADVRWRVVPGAW
jgi:protein-S-isoprenylcysteine O-methyltransferase Ste14